MSDLAMQFTVTKGDDGFKIDTFFAEGYDEQALLDVVDMWADFEVENDEEQSPGWGRP